MKRMGARALSWLLTFALLLGLCPAAVFAADIPDALVTSLAQLYDGDEARAREELEALYEAGIIDENGNLVELDVREDGESVELAALAQRISAGETVGAITVNGHAATPEQIVQISRVGDLLELVRALDGDVEITDEHVANLEALLAGIADGSVNLSSAIERGSLTLASSGDAASTVVSTGNVEATDGQYTQPMLDGSAYNKNYAFDLLDASNTAYYVDSRYNGVTLDGTVTLTCDKTTVDPGGTVTVKATLDEAQPLPVSFNWNASGAVLGDTVSGTVTWAAGETGDQTFTVTVPAKASAEAPDGETEEAKAARLAGLWNGGRAFVINAGNLKNAVFADNDDNTTTPPPAAWSKTVTVRATDKLNYPVATVTYPVENGGGFTKVVCPSNGYRRGNAYYKVVNYIPFELPFTLSVTATSANYTLYVFLYPPETAIGGTINGRNPTDGYNYYYYSLGTKWTGGMLRWYGAEVTHTFEVTELKRTNDTTGKKVPISSVVKNNQTLLVIFTETSKDDTPPNVENITITGSTPGVTADVTGITVSEGTYYSGEIVPITVEFNQPVGAKTGTTLTVNETACPLLDVADTQTQKLTFGYTVKDVDTGAVNVTAIDGVKNALGNAMNLGTSFESNTLQKSFGADDGVFLASNVKQGSVDWANAKYGVSKDGLGLTVMLPLNANKTWVVNEAVAFNPSAAMPLPGHATAMAIGYLPGAYFSCDGGKTRYPVYVVEDGGASFLVGRFTPPANDSDKLRYDTLNLFLATETLSNSNQADVTKYLPALSQVTDEGYGATEADAGVVMGKSWSYYIKGGVRFEELGITGRTGYDVQSYDKTSDVNYDATYNTLKLEDGRYVLLRDAVEAQGEQAAQPKQNPAQQYDVEVVASKAFMDAVKDGIRAENPSNLTLGYQWSSRKSFSYTTPANFTWASSNEDVARIAMDENGRGHISFTGTSGTVTFTLTVKNGGKPFTLATRTLRVIEGKDPFLNIPTYSQVVPTLTGTDTDVLFASNVTVRNAAVGQNTTFTAKLYKVSAVNEAVAGKTAVWTESFTSTTAKTVTHITVPGGQLSDPGVYAVEISTHYEGGAVDGVNTNAADLSATAYLTVKQAPVKVTLNKLESYSVTSDKVPASLGYTLASATGTPQVEYTIQKSGGTVSERTAPTTPGSIPFSAGVPTGLKDVYTVTVYARNSEDEAWSVDSLLLTVYNKDKLDIIISDVVAGAIGGTTGGTVDQEKGITVADGTTVTMDNRGKLAGYGVTDGAYQLTFSDFNSLRTDMSLQRIISANYGSGVWGLLSDKMKWASSDPDMVSVDYKQGGIYSDIRNYDYIYYAPDTDFLLAGKGETAEGKKVTITAEHANTGMRASFDVTTQTLDNELYMFQFLPKATTEVVYTNGSGVKRELKSNDQGELAVYEPSGIKSTVMVKSKKDGVTYVGTLYPEDLVSGERDIGALQLYPCNTVKLRAIGNAVLTFSKPDGNPYTGSVTIRAGVYKNGEYCPNALVRVVNGASVNRSGRMDYTTTLTDGKLTVGFDPDQFTTESDPKILWPGDKVSYVIEYRFGDGSAYRPGYVRLNVASDSKADVKAADSLIQLYAVSGAEDQPQISRQIMQQYYGETPTGYTRDVTGYTESIGVSPRFDKTELYTTLSLPGEAVTTGENGYSTYTATDDFGFALYIASSGKQLTGQTGTKVSKNTAAAQIVELSDLEDAPLFVFPFSSMPMARSVYTMTDANLSQDGVTDQGNTPSARVKAQITRGSLTIRSDTLPFGVSNVTHQKDLSQPGGGATEIAAEVKTDLTKRMDIGSAFRSVNVNEMLQEGFAFLRNLSGVAGSNQMFNMIIIPTEDPAVFRIAVLVGGKELGDDDGGGDGLSVNYDPNTLAEDIQEFEKALSDDDDDSNGEGKIEFSFSGALYLTAKCDIVHNKWDVAFTGGSVGTGVKGEYEWSQNFLCGPIPFFVEFKAGFGAEIEVSFVNKDEVRAMLLDTTLSLSLEAFAGLGFDLSIVAFKLGIFGQIGAAVNFQYLTQTRKSDMTGTKLSIDGEIGIKMEVKILLISYKKTFASTRFGWSKKYGSYDAIQREWENNGVAFLTGVTENGRAYAMRLFADGTALVAIEGGGEIENRDYLELAERAWNGGAPARRGLLRAASPNTLTDVQTNAYPYSNPVFTDDGGMFLYISDNDNGDEVQSVVSCAVKNGSGYNEGTALYNTENAILADSDVVASGTGNNAFAAWIKQMESPEKEMHDTATYDDLGMMMNATEIYAGSYNGTGWTTTRLTENNVADMAPTVASYGNRAIVAWRSLAATKMPAENDEKADIGAVFNAENQINYRIYNESAWTTAQVAYNGSAGTVNAIDSAMLSDGTALLVYTVRTDNKEVTSTETFYTLINKEGAVVTTGRLTNDGNTDTNAQVTTVGNSFVIGWYTEYENGEAAHDIRLARVNANGSVDETFPESIGSADINTSFTFSAPASNDSIDKLSIVWPETDDQGGAMKAVRFYQTNAAIGVTAPTTVAKTDAHFTVDQFDAYTGEDGTIHTLILGSDYNNTGINAYDTIDLSDTGLKVLGENDTPSGVPSKEFLNILEQTPVAHIKLGSGSFTQYDIEAEADFDLAEVTPGLTLPVRFTVRNTGTATLDSVTVKVDDQTKTFSGLSLLPNESAQLTLLYEVPESVTDDPEYKVTVTAVPEAEAAEGWLLLNRPDVGIADMKLLREGDGTRDIQVRLENDSNIPLSDNSQTVKLAFYKDRKLTEQLGEAYTVPPGSYADIDEGFYTYTTTLNVSDLIGTAEEIPEAGVTVYAKAWLECDGNEFEYDTSNNSASLSFNGLLTKYKEGATIDTALLTDGSGGYTVQADIRNNSLRETDLGDIIADVLDSDNKVLESITMQESLALGTEESKSITRAITVENGTPASVKLRSSTKSVMLDANGGVCAETSATLTKDGTLSGLLPEAAKAGYTFSGWFTQPNGGAKVTPETVFGDDDEATVKPDEEGVYVVYAQFTQRPSGSGSSTTTTTTTKDNTSNPDASTTNGTATVTTTKNADGSTTAKTTETATKASEDGSKTEVKAETTTTTKSNTDGTTTAATTSTETATTTAADGTKTVTETKTEAKETLNKSGNGTVEAKTTETVKDANGNVTSTTVTESKGTVETATDGTKTTTTTNTAVTTDAAGNTTTVVTTEKATETKDGNTGKVVSDESGKVVSVEAKVSEAAAQSAAKSGEAVTLPVTVTAAQSAAEATPVAITVPKDAESVKVEIPVEDVKPGTVAIIVHEDGTEEIVKTSTTSEGGVVLALEAGASVKVVDNTKTFNDVSGSEWYAGNVAWASSREVMSGVGNNTFAPNADTNRAMVTQILYNLDGGKAGSAIPNFNDVSAGDWYANSVAWAVSNGVARGEGSSFGANDAVTREQLAVMLYNYAGMKGYRTSDRGDMSRFADNGSTSAWASDAMAWAVGSGIINGMTDENGKAILDPQGKATRAQVTAMTERFCGKAAK